MCIIPIFQRPKEKKTDIAAMCDQSMKDTVAMLTRELEQTRQELSMAHNLCSLLQIQNNQLMDLLLKRDSPMQQSVRVDQPGLVTEAKLSGPVPGPSSASPAELLQPAQEAPLPNQQSSASHAELSNLSVHAPIQQSSASHAELSNHPVKDRPSHSEMMGHEVPQKPASSTLATSILQKMSGDQRPSKVNDLHWKDVMMPLMNDILLVSDSLFKSFDANFHREKTTSVFPFSGMRTNELLEVLYHQHLRGIKAEYLVICVGTNDYYRTPLSFVKTDLDRILKLARIISPRIVLCTIPASLWQTHKSRSLPYSFSETQEARSRLNTFIRGLEAPDVHILDLEHIFRSHRCLDDKTGWYQKDTLHPNTAGIRAMEICLHHVIDGEVAIPPRNVSFSSRDVSFRRKMTTENYARTTIQSTTDVAESSGKRHKPDDEDDSDDEESPVWKRR